MVTTRFSVHGLPVRRAGPLAFRPVAMPLAESPCLSLLKISRTAGASAGSASCRMRIRLPCSSSP